MTEEQEAISRKNKRLAWKHFYPEGNGKAKPGYVLHHKDPSLRHNNIERYILWRIEDLVIMTNAEHTSLHRKGNPSPNKGKHHSEEAKCKMSAWHKGKRHSEETKRKIGEAKKGKHLSNETRTKISEGNKGKHFTDEHKRKIGEAMKMKWARKKQTIVG